MSKSSRQVQTILTSLRFDQKAKPYSFALDTKNPVYTYTRAQELLQEASDGLNLHKLDEAVRYIILTKILLAEKDGTTQVEGPA